MMMREEAIELKAAVGRLMYSDNKDIRDYNALIDFIESALHPVSREQVEKMRGEWMFPIFTDQKDANDPRCQCSECGSIETPLARHRFCPSCGRPMTDEAVQMVMERMEALYEQKV